MKKALCASTIENAYSDGQTNIEIDQDTIITPLAQDLIEEYGLNVKVVKSEEKKDASSKNISEELIMSIIKKILKDSLNNRYVMRLDSNGLKVIDGSSIHFTDIPNCTDGGSGKYCSISYGNSNKSKFGLVRLNHTELTKTIGNDTYLYISKGALDISINENSCVSKEGDIIFIPKDANVTVKAFKDVELVYSLTE